jgi:Fusaric acid resistance protein family
MKSLAFLLFELQVAQQCLRETLKESKMRRQVGQRSQPAAEVTEHSTGKGEILFIIDPSTFKAALDNAEASVASLRATMDLRESNAARGHKLTSLSISAQQLQDLDLQAKAAEANYQQALAVRENAKINLDRTTVYAPVGIATSLRRAGEAGAAIILFGNGLAPENIMQYDVVAFFNGVLATIPGVGMVCLVQSLVFPDNANRRILAATKRLTHWIAASIGKGKLTGIEYVGATARPLNDLLALIDQSDDAHRADWGIDLYASGREIIELQNAQRDVTSRVADCGQRLIPDIDSLLQDPSPSHLLVANDSARDGERRFSSNNSLDYRGER